MPGFGDIWGGVAEGTEANQALTNNYYHNQAMNALTSTYGPQAGDPAVALQAQQYNYLSQQNPQLIQQQGLVNTGLGQENTLRAGLMPSQISAATAQASQAGSAAQFATGTTPGAIAASNAQSGTTVATQPAAVQQSFAAANKATADAAISGLNAQQATAYTHIRGGLTFANAADAYINSGMPPEQAFQAARTLAEKESGASAADVDAVANAQHDAFIANPSNVIGQIRQGSTTALQTQLMPTSSDQQIAAIKAGLDAQEARVRLVTGLQGNFSTADKQYKDILGQAGPLGTMRGGIDIAQSNLDAMQQLLPKLDPNNMVRVFKGEHIPGSIEDQFLELAKGVDGAMSIDTLQAGREASGGNLGFRTQNEFKAAGNSIANFSSALDPAQLQRQIANAKKDLTIMAGGADAVIEGNNKDYPRAVQRRQALEKQLNDAVGLSYDPGAAAIMMRPANIAPPGAASPAGASAPPSVSVTGGGAAPDFYKTAMTHESGGENKPNATGGAAFGYYQFEPGTWDDVRKAHSDLNLPTDVKQATFTQQDTAYRAFVGDNAATLSKNGVPINDKNVFMASFLGGDGASKFISAMGQNPDAPAATMFAKDAKENPTIFYTKTGAPRSLQQVYNMQTANFGAGNTTGFGGGSTAASPPAYSPRTTAAQPTYPPPNVQPAAPNNMLSAPPAMPTNPYGGQPNALGNLFQAPGQPPRPQAAAEPSTTQPSGTAPQPSQVASAASAPRPTGLETPPVLSQAQIRARIPDKVMDGRALLAKYLSAPHQRTA